MPVSFIGSFAEVTKWIAQRQDTALSLWLKDIAIIKFLLEGCVIAAATKILFVCASTGAIGTCPRANRLGFLRFGIGGNES